MILLINFWGGNTTCRASGAFTELKMKYIDEKEVAEWYELSILIGTFTWWIIKIEIECTGTKQKGENTKLVDESIVIYLQIDEAEVWP